MELSNVPPYSDLLCLAGYVGAEDMILSNFAESAGARLCVFDCCVRGRHNPEDSALQRMRPVIVQPSRGGCPLDDSHGIPDDTDARLSKRKK